MSLEVVHESETTTPCTSYDVYKFSLNPHFFKCGLKMLVLIFHDFVFTHFRNDSIPLTGEPPHPYPIFFVTH